MSKNTAAIANLLTDAAAIESLEFHWGGGENETRIEIWVSKLKFVEIGRESARQLTAELNAAIEKVIDAKVKELRDRVANLLASEQ